MPVSASEFPTDEWQKITESVPIAGADVVPTHFGADGTFWIGLIFRNSPFGGPRWCHIGGRQYVDETQSEAARRHLGSALMQQNQNGSTEDLDLEVVPSRPSTTYEFLRKPRDGFGFDPRKHAVSACYLVILPKNVCARPGNEEAIDFKWFPFDQLPDESELWPGTRGIVDLLTRNKEDDLASYQALSQRQVSHNSLMWQTPALAMSAQAFLLLIALGAGTPFASRVISSALGFVIALLSFQLMMRHSALELADARHLYAMELRRGMEPVHQRPVGIRGLAGIKSRILWMIGLLLFAVASLAALALAIGSLSQPSLVG